MRSIGSRLFCFSINSFLKTISQILFRKLHAHIGWPTDIRAEKGLGSLARPQARLYVYRKSHHLIAQCLAPYPSVYRPRVIQWLSVTFKELDLHSQPIRKTSNLRRRLLNRLCIYFKSFWQCLHTASQP